MKHNYFVYSILEILLHLKEKDNLLEIKMHLARVACDDFFEFHNLSLWVDSRATSLKSRFLYGFLSKKVPVDIVAKVLNDDENISIESSFYNFDYGDSDLG